MRLFRSLIALVLLATFAHATPEGWEQRNGSMRSTGVQNDATAIERGGEFYLNLEELRLEMYPWMDGSGDVLTMRPVLPAGTRVVRPDGAPVRDGLVEVPHGWRADLEGGALDGVVLRLMDLQGDKVPEALDDFLAPGLALIYTFDASAVPTTGEWIAKRIAFGGIADDCNFWIQPYIEGETQPKWVPGSIAIYHKTKQNSGGYKRYTTGKIAHLPRPLMVGRNANGITGYAFGEYREVSHGVFDKIFDMDAILATPSQTITKFGIGAPTSIHVSADIGLSDHGGSVYISAALGRRTISQPHVATEDGDVTAIKYYTEETDSRHGGNVAMYSGTTRSALDDVAGTHKPRGNFDTLAAGLATWGVDPNVAITNGTTYSFYWMGYGPTSGDDDSIEYDNVASGSGGLNASGTADVFDDPLDVAAWADDTRQITMWAEYTPTVTTPISTNVVADPTNLVKGLTSTFDLTADIDGGAETITAAEWYRGIDPGEGSGNAMSLGAGTITREASDTINPNTEGFPTGANDVYVRGESSEGWGAAVSVEVTVTLAAPQNVAATAGDEEIVVTWDAVVGAVSYKIWTHTSSPATGGTFENKNESPYTKTGLTNGTPYFFIVQAQDAVGPGAESSEVSATPEAAAGDSSGLNLGLGLGL